MHTIGMDTYGLIAHGVAAAGGQASRGGLGPSGGGSVVKPQPVSQIQSPDGCKMVVHKHPSCARPFAAR